MKVSKGYSYYGQEIGILVNQSVSPRVAGDAGVADTFDYPVQYQITGTSFGDLIDGSPEAYQKLLNAAKQLKDRGVKGIVGDCGLMSLYQKEITNAIGIPFVSASLILIPTVWQIIGCEGKIGIITGHSDFLKGSHLKGCGWSEDVALAFEGLQHYDHFSEIVINGGMDLDVDKMCADLVASAKNLVEREPDVRAIILECSNLPTYAKAIQEAVNLPVFDTVAAANLLQYSISPIDFMNR